MIKPTKTYCLITFFLIAVLIVVPVCPSLAENLPPGVRKRTEPVVENIIEVPVTVIEPLAQESETPDEEALNDATLDDESLDDEALDDEALDDVALNDEALNEGDIAKESQVEASESGESETSGAELPIDENGEIDYEKVKPASINGLKLPGTATVKDYAEVVRKEFYTFLTADGTEFYLVIDMDKKENNAYFLQPVTDDDLKSSVSKPEQVASEMEQLPAAPQESAETPKKNASFSNGWLAIILVGGGSFLGLLFLKAKNKSSKNKVSKAAEAFSDADDVIGDEVVD